MSDEAARKLLQESRTVLSRAEARADQDVLTALTLAVQALVEAAMSDDVIEARGSEPFMFTDGGGNRFVGPIVELDPQPTTMFTPGARRARTDDPE